jgi:hypothetical protein
VSLLIYLSTIPSVPKKHVILEILGQIIKEVKMTLIIPIYLSFVLK